MHRILEVSATPQHNAIFELLVLHIHCLCRSSATQADVCVGDSKRLQKSTQGRETTSHKRGGPDVYDPHQDTDDGNSFTEKGPKFVQFSLEWRQLFSL